MNRIKVKLSALDRRILNRLQDGIPFEEKPWEAVAKELKIGESLLLKRIASLKKAGIIRRISAVFSPRKIDFVSTLVAVKAAPGAIGRIAKVINLCPEVTHNYRRSGPYDLWFTLVAKDKNRIAQILRRLKKNRDVEGIAQFPCVKLFKIDVKFRV